MSAPVPRKRSQADSFLLQSVELSLPDFLAFLVHAAVWRLHPHHVAASVHPAVWKPSLLECTSQLFDELMPHAAKLAEHAAAEGHPSVPLQGYQTLESGSDVVRLLLARCHLRPAPCHVPPAACVRLPTCLPDLPPDLLPYLATRLATDSALPTAHQVRVFARYRHELCAAYQVRRES